MPYGRDKTSHSKIEAQKALLANTLNFETPKKSAPQARGQVDGGSSSRPKGVSPDPDFAAHRNAIAAKLNAFTGGGGGVTRAGGITPKALSKDPNFAANRNAIAGKLNNPGGPTTAIPKPTGGKEFHNQKAALASKLNFRPPVPSGDPRLNPSNIPPTTTARSTPSQPSAHSPSRPNDEGFAANRAAIASQLAFGKPKQVSPPKPAPPPPRRNIDNGSDFANQRAALANNLNFRPPLPASQTLDGPNVSPIRPTTGRPVTSPEQEYRQEPRYPSNPVTPDDGGIAAKAAAVASRMKANYPEYETIAASARSMEPPPNPEMSFVKSSSFRKKTPPPAEPDMNYVRSYRIGGAEETEVDEEDADEDGRVQVVLIRDRIEWGTRPLNKRYQGNRVVVKHFTTFDEEEQKRQKSKKKGGCTIM